MLLLSFVKRSKNYTSIKGDEVEFTIFPIAFYYRMKKSVKVFYSGIRSASDNIMITQNILMNMTQDTSLAYVHFNA